MSAAPKGTIEGLQAEIERLRAEIAAGHEREREALEQQTATSEILRVIASSPTDLQLVLQTVVESAARLCDAIDATLRRVDGGVLRFVAAVGPGPSERGDAPIQRQSIHGRAVIERRTIHVHDLDDRAADEFPIARAAMANSGLRTLLATPMLREGVAIGTILIRRYEVRPFTDRQIALLETFADQAVIAIENARLFSDLTASLEQQTAMAHILSVVASTPADLQPVLDAVVESASRLCDAEDALVTLATGDMLRQAAHIGPIPSDLTPFPVAGSVVGEAMLQRRTVHVHDIAAPDSPFPISQERAGRSGWRTALVAPLLREHSALGGILLRRTEVRPFTDEQIALLETFADQAVIAIENTRLFEELESRNSDLAESLEQQTATSEVLRVIASSPADLEAVLNAVAENAMRLCEATDAVILRRKSDAVETLAHVGTIEWLMEEGLRPLHNRLAYGLAMLERRTVHYEDVLAGPPPIDRHGREVRLLQEQLGVHTVLAIPLLRPGDAIGAIYIRRTDVRPFTDKQIALLETFADQAVIAIENARLFGELQDRTRELAQSVDELQALGVVSQAVSSTLDLQQVLTTVLEHAVELSGMDGGTIFEYDDTTGEFHDRATVGLGQEVTVALRSAPLRAGEGMVGRAIEERQPVQVADIVEEGAFFSRMRERLIEAGYRAMLAVPLLRDDEIIGGLAVRRGTPGEVPPHQVELLRTFATQSALAIQNARLFNELAEKSQQLEIASQHKSQFLANMSHELRTPLNAILGYTELILDEIYGPVPEKIGTTLERVQHSGRHLLALINDVLDLSKMEAGQLDLAPQEYALADVIQTVQTAVESLAAEKGIGLRSEIAPDLPMGYGDDRRLVQVILNLVGNAIKFTDEGEVVIRAEARTEDGRPETEAVDVPGLRFSVFGPVFLVTVTDTGAGIPEANRATIFEEFQQADTSSTREKGGTGLGLSIARRIVEMHGGRIWVDSTEGQGSTFTFTIPVRVEA